MSTPPKFHTLGSLQIPRGLVWVDEFSWSRVDRASEHGTTGALLLDVAVRQAGRPITLQADSNAGWMQRSALQALYAMAEEPTATYALTLADGRSFEVMFASADPIAAQPVARPELPKQQHPYIVTIKLIEV